MAQKGITLDTSVLDRIAKELKPNVQKRIAKSAFRVEGKAKQLNTRVDTGAHVNSGYTVAPGVDTFSMGATRAQSLNPKALIDAKVLPKNDMSAVVGFLMAYSLWIEIGTSKMAASPHLVPAMESEEKLLVDDLKQMIK